MGLVKDWSSNSEGETRSGFISYNSEKKGLTVMRNTIITHWCVSPSQTQWGRRGEFRTWGGKVSSLLFKKSTACSYGTGEWGVGGVPEGFMSPRNTSCGKGKDQSPCPSPWGCLGRGHPDIWASWGQSRFLLRGPSRQPQARYTRANNPIIISFASLIIMATTWCKYMGVPLT